MWTDNETDRDFLNFSVMASTISQIIVRANGQPVSIGVSGSWGVGKSSMIKLIRKDLLQKKSDCSSKKYIFVEFNAWLYQGYDDARAALMDVIAKSLQAEAAEQKTALSVTKGLFKRINWLRIAKLTSVSAASMAMGLPPVGLLGSLYDLGHDLNKEGVSREEMERVQSEGGKVTEEVPKLIKPKNEYSPPEEIEAIRSGFEEALTKLDVTLVVLIDDLDRCLPETAISTLEALRLFLFLKQTAFVIAADTQMIRHSVRKHFDGIDDKLVTNYFDKLIQIPIQIPKLGLQDIKAYLSLLYIDLSDLSAFDKDKLRETICEQLSKTWKGARIDRTFIASFEQDCGVSISKDLSDKLNIVNRLAPLMTSETAIEANPRLIKRFLNSISIQMSIGEAQGIALDEGVLTKILILERCGSKEAFKKIAESSADNENGFPEILKAIELKIKNGKALELENELDTPFFKQWASTEPFLSQTDLRPVFFVSRDNSPLLLSHESISSAGAKVLDALISQPDMANSLESEIESLSDEDLNLILDKLLEIAGRENSWGVPDILTACIAIAKQSDLLGNRLGSFLRIRPSGQIEASIVPKIRDEKWVDIPFNEWKENGNIDSSVKSAIKIGE